MLSAVLAVIVVSQPQIQFAQSHCTEILSNLVSIFKFSSRTAKINIGPVEDRPGMTVKGVPWVIVLYSYVTILSALVKEKGFASL